MAAAVVVALAVQLAFEGRSVATAPTPATADTYVDLSQDTAHSSETTIGVRAGSVVWRSYVRVDLPSPPTGETVSSATLRLTVTQPPAEARSIAATRVTSAWAETITASTQPPIAAAATAQVSVSPSSGVVEWDVTADVAAFYAGAANYGWSLRYADEGGSAVLTKFASREAGAGQPELDIVFAPAPTPSPSPSPSPTLSPSPTPTPTASPSPTPTPAPPAAPAIDGSVPVATPAPSVVVTGTKQAGSGIWLNGASVVAVGVSSTWSFNVPLTMGANALNFVARDATGQQSPTVTVTITRLPVAISILVDRPASPTRASQTTLTGARSPNTSVEINGIPVALSGTGQWSATVSLMEGNNTFLVVGKAGGQTSAPVVVTIVRDSTPPGAIAAFRSTPERDTCTVADAIEARWNAPSDDGTGVVGYRYRWGSSPTGEPSGDRTATGPEIRSSLGPGLWYLHLAAEDGAGNVAPARRFGPFCLLANDGVIAGSVYTDLDADGRFGPEPGLGGWRISARTAEFTLEATTAADGSYEIRGPMGSYDVCVQAPSRSRVRWLAVPGVVQRDGGFCRTGLIGSGPRDWLDFGLAQPAAIGGVVFDDLDRDGRRDPDESGLGGVAVRVADGSGRAVTAISGPDGAYALDLAPGEHLLCLLSPPGRTLTTRTSDGDCLALAVRSGHDVRGPALGLAVD